MSASAYSTVPAVPCVRAVHLTTHSPAAAPHHAPGLRSGSFHSMQDQDDILVKREEEFSRPVESIMRCDFKSNFARRLSNRYIARTSSSSQKQVSSLLLRPADLKKPEVIPVNVPERSQLGPQLSENLILEQNSEAVVKTPGEANATVTPLQQTEVAALRMEVDTLRWQLSQTEANRQMHIVLLNQIVTFLNRVKVHIQSQKADSGSVTNITKAPPKSFHSADLPRSRSVVHVDKHMDYSLCSVKKISSRKISKSISNVNGFKECSGTWSQPNISMTSETDTQKITEEMSRLITLANTVLGTKLPDLTCACNDTQIAFDPNDSTIINNKLPQNCTGSAMDLIEEDNTSKALVIENISNASDLHEDLPSSLVDSADSFTEYIIPPSTLTCDFDDNVSKLKLDAKNQKSSIFKNKSNGKSPRILLNNGRLDYNETTNNFIEDESGFSSMSSFQEIGIPIISIIPPSPCKEVNYVDDIPEFSEESGKWEKEIDLNKATVKVFWV